jgi:hypothetical protein
MENKFDRLIRKVSVMIEDPNNKGTYIPLVNYLDRFSSDVRQQDEREEIRRAIYDWNR